MFTVGIRSGVRILAGQRASVVLIAMLLVVPVLIAIGTVADGTWTLPAPGKGLSQHYGFWALFATGPTMVILTRRLLARFRTFIGSPDEYTVQDASAEVRQQLARLAARHVRSLSLDSRSIGLLGFVVFAYLAWWLINVAATWSPERVYGHDVFDAGAHPWGYYLTRGYLLLVFCGVYAPATFTILHVTFSLVTVLRFVTTRDVLAVDFFHRDNCAGTSRFGNLNLLVLGLYAHWYSVIFAMYLTHGRAYAVMVISLLSCSLLAVGQSTLAVRYIYQAVSAKRLALLTIVAKRLNHAFADSMQSGCALPNELLSVRNHLIAVHAFPYAGRARVAVNLLRFAPAAMALFGLFRG